MSRCIDADELMEILTTAIRNMKGIAKFLGAEDDPEIQMEIKAYTDIANWVNDAPTIEPERKKDTIQKFHDYQVEWLLSHYDLELEPQLEELIMRFLHDTANRYMMEEGGHG